MNVWLIIGAAFMLPLSAADSPKNKQISTGELLCELLIIHTVENPSHLENFFGISTHLNTYLESQWDNKVKTWNITRKNHLKKWVDAHTQDKVTIAAESRDVLHAALYTDIIHPCDTFENDTDEKIKLLKDYTKNKNSNVFCFISAFVNRNNNLLLKKYLYKETTDVHIYCNNEIAWIDALDDENKESSTGICYDFKTNKFSSVEIVVQCESEQISTSWFETHAPELFEKITENDTFFYKRWNTLYFDLEKIESYETINALECYMGTSYLSKLTLNHIPHLQKIIKYPDLIDKMEEKVNFNIKVRKKRGQKFFYSLIRDEFSFYRNGQMIVNYKNSTPVLNPFTKARFEYFCKNWDNPDPFSIHLYWKNFLNLFKSCTSIIIDKKHISRYDALNHVVRILELKKDTQGVVTVNDHGDTQVPANINFKTLHVKKDGTLTYKTHSKST